MSDNDSVDELSMEEEMNHLNISVSTQSLPPFSHLEKPLTPIRASFSLTGNKTKTGKSLLPRPLNKGPGEISHLSLDTVSTTPLFQSVADIVTNSVNSYGKRA